MLAQSPIFARLGPLDLAKLAGELEEVAFPRGSLILREGDPGDAMYIVKYGSVAIYRGDEPEAIDGLILGPGAVIGDIALITNATRSASAMAYSDVMLWRLASGRFLGLLDRERAVALSVERALCDRITDTTSALLTEREQREALMTLLVRCFDPAASDLLFRLALVPSWQRATVDAICRQNGEARALEELLATPGYLLQEDDVISVSPTITTSLRRRALKEDDDAWLARAGEAARSVADDDTAIELFLRSNNADEALALIEKDRAQSAAASSMRLKEWRRRIVDIDPALADRVDAALARSAEELGDDEPDINAYMAQATIGRTRVSQQVYGVLDGVRSPQLYGLLGAAALFSIGWFAPIPDGLTRSGQIALCSIAASLPLLLFQVLPNYAVAVLLAAVLVVPGIVDPATALAGMGTPSWLMILTLLAISATLSNSGLLFRLALLAAERLPANFIVQSLSLSLLGAVLSAGVATGNARVALAAPSSRELSAALHYGKQSAGSAALGLSAFISFTDLGTLFVTGSPVCLLLLGMLPEPFNSQATWGFWFLAALAPNFIFFALSYLFIMLRLRPPLTTTINLNTVQIQRQLLGKATRKEILSIVLLVALIVGFATQRYHGISLAWIAVGVFLILVVTKTLDTPTFERGVNWGLMIYFGILGSLGGVLAALHIDTWLTGLAQYALQDTLSSPYAFLFVIASLAFLVHFVVPWPTASPILALVTIPLAISAGFNPLIPVIVILFAGDHSFLPVINPTYLAMHYATEGELFTHDQARPILLASSLFRIVAVVASVPYWDMLGLL